MPDIYHLLAIVHTGFLTEVKRTDTNTSIWKRELETAEGLPKQYLQSTGIRTTFSYDNFNLLTCSPKVVKRANLSSAAVPTAVVLCFRAVPGI